MDIFADQIGFDVDFITNPTDAQISVLQSKWDDRHRKALPRALIDRETNAVESDGAF